MAKDRYYINGVDVTSLACITSVDGSYTTPVSRGENIVIPGRSGEIVVEGNPYTSGTFTLGLTLATASQEKFNDGYRALRKLCNIGRAVTLTRVVNYSSGQETHTANAQYQSGLEPAVSFLRFGKMSLSFTLTDGVWYSSTTTSTSVTGLSATVFNNGETWTDNMTILMPQLGAIRNNTTGHTLILTSGASPVSIDTTTFRATRVSDGADLSSSLIWSKPQMFMLREGTNSLTFYNGYPSNGTTTFTYRGAYW